MRDKTLIFSEDQTLIIVHSTPTMSTNVIDITGGLQDQDGFFSSIDANIGEGTGLLEINLVLSTAYVGNAAGLTVDVYDHTTATITSGTRRNGIWIPNGAAAGTPYVLRIPIADLKRYVGLVITAITGNGTAGALSAWIGVGHQSPV
jgi:hypothetical protein